MRTKGGAMRSGAISTSGYGQAFKARPAGRNEVFAHRFAVRSGKKWLFLRLWLLWPGGCGVGRVGWLGGLHFGGRMGGPGGGRCPHLRGRSARLGVASSWECRAANFVPVGVLAGGVSAGTRPAPTDGPLG
jgi:hypothetical protein